MPWRKLIKYIFKQYLDGMITEEINSDMGIQLLTEIK